jgi:hypothetical protein
LTLNVIYLARARARTPLDGDNSKGSDMEKPTPDGMRTTVELTTDQVNKIVRAQLGCYGDNRLAEMFKVHRVTPELEHLLRDLAAFERIHKSTPQDGATANLLASFAQWRKSVATADAA